MNARKRAAKKVAGKRGPKVLADPELMESTSRPVERVTAKDREAEAAAEKRRQAAFDAEFSFRGVKLEPFSISREMVFLQLRTALGAPELGKAMENTISWWPDGVRLLWLCSHVPEDWELLRGEPLRLNGAIEEWAESQGLRAVIPDVRYEVAEVTLKLWNAAQENIHVPAGGRGKEPGN